MCSLITLTCLAKPCFYPVSYDTDNMPTWAIIGASRGIGLEYVRQLVSLSFSHLTSDSEELKSFQAARPDTTIFAVVRNAKTSTYLASAVATLENVHVVEADVADYSFLEACNSRTIRM